MGVIDPRLIRLEAEAALGPITEGPATWGVLPEGVVVELPTRARVRLARSEPCIFLGPPVRSRLLIATAILDPSEMAEHPVRAFASVEVVQLAGLWVTGLEDAASRFPAASLDRKRPEAIALPSGTPVWPVGEALPERLVEPQPAFVVGRDRASARRAAVLVRAPRRAEAVWLEAPTET